MKVFLSVPMKNRTKENIEKSLEKMRQYARIAFGNDVEFINTVVQDKPPYTNCNEAVWYLGQSISLMSQADMFVCVDTPYWLESKGCEVEKRTFFSYLANEIPSNFIELPIRLVMDREEYEYLCKKNLEEQRPVRDCIPSVGTACESKS